jgi:hypothetical protein
MRSLRRMRTCILPLAWLCLGAPAAWAQPTIEAKDTTGALRPSFAIGEIAWAAVTNVGSTPICYLPMPLGTTELFRGEAIDLEQQVNGNWRAYTAVKGFVDQPSFTYKPLPGKDTTVRSWRSSPGTRTFTVGQAGAPAPAPAPGSATLAGTANIVRLLKIARLEPDRPVGTGAKFWLRVQYTRANNHPAFVTAFI